VCVAGPAGSMRGRGDPGLPGGRPNRLDEGRRSARANRCQPRASPLVKDDPVRASAAGGAVTKQARPPNAGSWRWRDALRRCGRSPARPPSGIHGCGTPQVRSSPFAPRVQLRIRPPRHPARASAERVSRNSYRSCRDQPDSPRGSTSMKRAYSRRSFAVRPSRASSRR
jgi:hypothetical protein